jgi:murein DD-endopeptidase MepM/ murein hydrolase activator NlpD
MKRLLFIAIVSLTTATCGGGPTAPEVVEICNGFAPWQTSEFVLPFAVNAAYFVSQANCSPSSSEGGHRGVKKFGYDFDMPIGTPIHAARAGVVFQVEASHFDGQIAFTGLDNYIVIAQADGTADLYGHLTHDGVAVALGATVTAGQLIGFSGNTGNTANNPHLHFSVQTCDPVSKGTANCPTLPVTFRNTDPNPNGLQVGRTYQARPY